MEYLADMAYIELKTNGIFQQGENKLEARRLLDDYRKLRSVQLQFSLALGMAPAARRSLASTGDALDLPTLFVAEAPETPQDAPDASGPASGPETPAPPASLAGRAHLNGNGSKRH
jgi:hypothetical protein